MKQRHVLEVDIEMVLLRYDFSKPGHDGGHEYIGKARAGRRLKVWTKGGFPPTEPVIIKSVAWRE
jgi:hypothetical protein